MQYIEVRFMLSLEFHKPCMSLWERQIYTKNITLLLLHKNNTYKTYH